MGATATDNVDGDISANIRIDTSAVDTNSVGNYSVTYNVSDAVENPATEVIRTVRVTLPADTEAPIITLTGDNPQIIELGTAYTELGATATDNVDGDISINIIIDDTAVDINSVGNYSVTYNVSDAAGNPAIEVTIIVNVVDTTAPIITLLGFESIEINQGDDYTDAGAEVIDNDPAYSGKIITDRGEFDKNIAGSYTITYSAPADASKNNPIEKTRTVVVEPVIVTYISVFPNPTKKNIQIDNLTEETTYVLSNAIGQILKKGIWTKINKASIDISSFPDGIYLLNVNTSQGIAVRRIIKIR